MIFPNQYRCLFARNAVWCRDMSVHFGGNIHGERFRYWRGKKIIFKKTQQQFMGIDKLKLFYNCLDVFTLFK
jgi:hypothetical protein